jgi:DMSO/TMAO reductase YedYZ molybdopterin-dependent catalytic subunit
MVCALRRVLALVVTPPRVGPFSEGAFTSRLHDRRPAAWLGMALGVAFGICFVTGLLSDLIQNPQPWFSWVPRPAWLYRVTQGAHVLTGLAAIPLLLVKLWVVYPRLWAWPTVRGVAQAIERAALVPLVAGALFLLVTGVQNIAYWYPWRFSFLTGHYWAAWITVGALVIHIGAKAGVAGQVWRDRDLGEERGHGAALDRRRLLGTAGLAAGAVVLTVAGETIPFLRRLAVLAPRDIAVGPQGFPVNKSARDARVEQEAMDPDWRLVVEGAVPRPLELSLDDLRAMELHEAVLPIACVEGWSVTQRWRGVRVADLVAQAGGQPGGAVRVESLQSFGPYRATTLNPAFAADPDTLLALDVGGEPLHLDHGFPLRLIAPNNPGVLQTKWLAKVVVQ